MGALRGRRPGLGVEQSDRAGRARRRRRARARLHGAHRRGDPRRAGAVRRRPGAGRHRRAAHRDEPDRVAGRGAGAERRLPRLRGRGAPVEHRQAGVRRRHPWCPGRPAAGPRHEPVVGPPAARDRGLPAPRDGRALRAVEDVEVQGQAGPHAGLDARGAAAADGPRRARGPHGPQLAGAAHPGRDRHPQGRPAVRRGPGRRGGVRLRRAVRGPLARAGHDLRQLRARLHRHAHAARLPRRDPAGGRGVRAAPARDWPRSPRSTSPW